MMSHSKVRLIVALSAAAIITSASTARAENKKKSFAELLSPSISVATPASSGSSRISQSSFATRAASANTGIQAATARGNLTLAQYRRLVYRELVQNRNNLFAALRLYQRELRSGQLTRAQYNASRLNALVIWTGYSAAFQTEYATGTQYYFTSPIGVGPSAIKPGAATIPLVTPTVVPPLTTIR
jgi:hypothetical protein